MYIHYTLSNHPVSCVPTLNVPPEFVPVCLCPSVYLYPNCPWLHSANLLCPLLSSRVLSCPPVSHPVLMCHILSSCVPSCPPGSHPVIIYPSTKFYICPPKSNIVISFRLMYQMISPGGNVS